MGNNDFVLNIIAALNNQLSKAQLKNDIKGLDNTLFVKVIAKLATVLSKKQLGDSLKQMNDLYVQVGTKFKTDKNAKNELLKEIEQLQKNITELQLKVGVEHGASKNVISSVISTAKTAQRYADKTAITLDIEVRKEKAVNDILYIGQRYSKLFSNVSASQKYENLLNSAYSISDKAQLQEVRAQISAFTSDLKAHGLAVQSTGDKWRKLTERAKDLFSAASIVRMVFSQTKQAVSTTIDLDKAYTGLVKVQSELTRNDYPEYLERCNKKAQELATSQKALIQGAEEFSKSGYDLSTSDKLTEKSAILSNVGEMSASDSAKAIISGVQAYDVVDGYTDVVEKAQALIDKYNEIGNTESIMTKEVAEGVQTVGSVFADANTNVDEFIALLAAGNRQFQDADSLALGLRTSALRIRGCTAELEAMGEETDTVVLSTAKLEEKIKALTNVNGSGGVEILEADKETFRSIYDIFADIGKVYKDMSDTDQSALLELIAGKHRASAISATLNNMTEAEEILERSINAAGSAQKEYDTYLESTEAHIQQFQSKLVETYSTFMNGDMISHTADIGTAILDLVNKTDLLKHSLVAIATIKIGQGITAVGGAIAGTVTQMNTLGNALQQIKNLPLDDVLKNDVLSKLGESTKLLTEKNLKLLLSQQQLSTQDKINILSIHGLTEEEARAKLETMGLTTVTNANTTANTANAGSVSTLKGAFTGLTTSIKAAWAAMSALQKASIIFAAISTAWSIGSSIINGIKQHQEELRQATEEAADAYKDSASSIEDYASRYQELHKALLAAKGDEEETYNVKKQLISLQTELNDKFGEEYGAINLVTDAYKDQTEAVRAYNKEAAQTFLNENEKGIRDAVSQMTTERHFTLSNTGIISSSDEGRILKELAEKYEDQGVTILDESGDGSTFSIHLKADAQSAYDTINAFESDIRDKATELGDEHMFDDILEISSSELSSAKETIDKYGDIFRQALTAQIASDDNKAGVYGNALKAVEEYNEAVLKSEDPYNDEDVESARKNLETVKEGIYSNEEEWGKYHSVMDDVFDQADTKLIDFNNKLKNDNELKKLAQDLDGMDAIDVQSLNPGENVSYDRLKESAEQYGLEVDELTEALIRLGYVQGEIQSKNTGNEPITFDSESFSETIEALSSLQSVYSEFYNNVKDNNDFTFEFSDIENLREAFGDTCAEFENFEKLATSSSTSAEELQESFDTLATQYVIASLDGLNESTREQIVSQLELQGIIGSSELLTEELASAYGILSDNGYTLADATDTAYWSLLDEANASEITKGSIYALAAAEIAYNNTGLDVQGKISQLGELAQAYGDTATAAIAQAAADRVANGHGDYESVYADMMASVNRAAQASTLKLGQSSANASKGKSGSRSKKETEETFDWIEKKIENLEEDLSRLDKVSSSAYSSISEKNEALAESISKINEEIDLQQQAYERYMEKAESVGLSDEYKNLVQNGAVDIESITDDDLKEAIKNYEQWYDKAKEAQDKIDDLYDDAKDKHVEAYELEAGEIEKLREDQAITEREYLDTMLALYEKYYAGQADFANQAKEAKLKYLREEKDYLNTVAEAASSLLDDQIDETEDEKDKARKAYEDEIAGIEESIKAKEKEKDAIQLKIDALKDEGDELDRQKNLLDAIKSKEEALYALERAKSQRSQLLYKDGQMIYDIDGSKIREANQNVDDAQAAVDKAERDIRIANLQIEIDTIQKGIDALEDEKAGMEALADESDAFFDKKIADMKEYQNEWKKALEIEERAVAFENLKAMFGDDAAEQILAHNITLLTGWKQEYIDTMAAIDLAANGSVGSITSEWGELANISVDMDNAMQLAGLSVDGLSDKAEKLGSAFSETADASERAGAALRMTDISNAGEQFHNVGLSAQNAQEQINGITEKLNALTSDVQNYTIPAINSEQFTASLGTADGTGGILGDLNTFIERFREICSSIPSIWDAAMSSMGGVGAANGEDVSYGYLFKPLVNAMDAAGQEIDAKLKEYTESWTQFNTDLGGIIGVKSGTDTDAVSGKAGSGVLKSPLSVQKNERQAGTDTIVGTIESGGKASVSALNGTWIPGFEGFASSIDSICSSICSMVEDMANDVIDMANKALKAMKEVEAKNTGAYKIGKAGSGYSSHPVSAANAYGTLSSVSGRGAVTKDQKSLVNELGNEMLIRDGVLHEITGGAQEIQLKKGDIILNHKQTEELKKYDRVTSGGGHGELIGSFASGTVSSSGVSILDNDIRDMWSSEEFKKLLAYVEKLRDGQSILIDQNNTVLKGRDGSPYREGTIITPKGDVYTPLPDDHPTIQLQKKFESYLEKIGGIEVFSAGVMAQHTKQMETLVKQITNSSVVTNNNNNFANHRPSVTIGDIHVTCPGVTRQQVAEQLGYTIEDRLDQCFNGFSVYADQNSKITR